MRLLLRIAALLASTMAVIACLSVGGFLAGVEEAGARGAGVLLLIAALLAFGAAIFVVVASGRVRRARGRLVLGLAAILALVPVVAMSGAALFFSGNPLGGVSPYLDWGSFSIGAVLAIGAVAIAALAIWQPKAPPQLGGTKPSEAEQQPQRSAPGSEPFAQDDEVRVRSAVSQPGGAEA